MYLSGLFTMVLALAQLGAILAAPGGLLPRGLLRMRLTEW